MLLVLAVLLFSGWLSIIWAVCVTVREAARRKGASRDGGIALVLATELHDRQVTPPGQLSHALLSLYLTEKMLFDHQKFRSMYDRIPDDYPDAYTINRAKILQEERSPRHTLNKLTTCYDAIIDFSSFSARTGRWNV